MGKKMNIIREFLKITRLIVLSIRQWGLILFYGMDISSSARLSLGAKLDKTNPKGIHIGEESFIASRSIILSHDYCRGPDINKGIYCDTYIGKRCFIGVNVIILPGITIGDSVVVGAGSVVTKNVPSNCIVAGNPGKIIKENIETGKFGKLLEQSTSSTTSNKVLSGL